MEISPFMFKLTKMAIETLIKTTNADIRVHGEENIPNQPIVYVLNHFTRMETFFMPYIIDKYTGKIVISLTFHGLMGGGFGNYLEKIGAVSTNAPDRDRIMIGSLLKGDMPIMIYPEGQMVKDKKLVEKGKYMIYNAGIRRPPHTGAAIVALRSQFYREKFRYFYETGFEEGLSKYMEYFNINLDEDLNKIINQETFVVPVNITYYPIRARNNALNRIAEKFVDKLPDRIGEELQVEGAMLFDGVDIDINFGKGIPVKNIIEDRKIQNIVKNQSLFLEKEEIDRDLNFRKQGIDLMYKYMDCIYDMTTVNHDHIFAYILSKYNKIRIKESDFKNRAYLAIDMVRDLNLKALHSTLLKLKQGYLLTDDEHDKYNSFIDAAVSNGLIKRRGGYIIKKSKRFSKPYEFHSVRKDNIVEVLKNEIEPVKNLCKNIDKIMRIPAFCTRKKIRERVYRLDKFFFEKDYEDYFIEGETKPREIGSPFFFKRFFRKRGVLLVHGYLAAPEEIRELADYLYKVGYTVYGARVRGHGTAPEDLAQRTWREWYESVNRGYVVLKNYVKEIAIVGFSTGGLISLLQAANKPGAFKAVVTVNAPLSLKNIASRLASAVVVWNNFMSKINVKKGKMEYVTNNPENPHINYFRNPVSGVSQLEKFMHIVSKRIKDLKTPILIIQGSDDPIVKPDSGREIFEEICINEKELFRVYADRHGILRGEGADKIFMKISRFLFTKFKHGN